MGQTSGLSGNYLVLDLIRAAMRLIFLLNSKESVKTMATLKGKKDLYLKNRDKKNPEPVTNNNREIKSGTLIKAADFLKNGPFEEADPALIKIEEVSAGSEKTPLEISPGGDYHVRAGRIGGETTKQRHRESNFYREIGARGGTITMARHGAEYGERRKKGGETTRERYGEGYYQVIAAKAARTKQDATRLRNEAIKILMEAGFKIPTIIKFTLKDLLNEPRLKQLSETGPLADYLETRPATGNEFLFLSQSGKPLSLANTYTVMERHRDQGEI